MKSVKSIQIAKEKAMNGLYTQYQNKLNNATSRIVKILANQPALMLDYKRFAAAYSGNKETSSALANRKTHTIVEYANKYFQAKNIPLAIKRYNNIVKLEANNEEE